MKKKKNSLEQTTPPCSPVIDRREHIRCGNYLWNKFTNFKTNNICRNRLILISHSAYYKLLHFVHDVIHF
jgi:hypothetical protein